MYSLQMVKVDENTIKAKLAAAVEYGPKMQEIVGRISMYCQKLQCMATATRE